MHSRFSRSILILLILALTASVLVPAVPAAGNTRTVPVFAPVTTTTAPVKTVPCAAPCQCLVYADAVSTWGASGFTQCAEHPCEVSRSVTGAPVEKYCFKQKQQVAAATTTIAKVLVPVRRITTVTQEVHAPLGQVCGIGLNKCDATCVNIQTDPLNCGSCGYQCSPGEPCTAGSCGTGCPAGMTECRSGECLNLKTDANNCGSCGNTCGLNQYCTEGMCTDNGKYRYRQSLGLDSPYFVADVNDKFLISTFLETDSVDNNLKVGTSDFPLIRNWADYTTLTIGKDTKDAYHPGNFRFNSSEKNVRMFLWQVSRYQFPDDPHNWQARYIPGLVAQGPVVLLHGGFANNNLETPGPYETSGTLDGDGFQYFRINFTRVASHNPGDQPYYDGIAHLNPAGPGGQVVVADIMRLPFNAGGLSTQRVNISIVSLVIPTGYTTIPPLEYTESEMGYPNEGLTLTCADCAGQRNPSPLEDLMTGGDQKFFVRLVPVYNDGTAGIPSIPVRVTVHRPQPCPTITGDITVKPPSARIVWYMRPTGSLGGESGITTQWVTIGHALFQNGNGGYDTYESGMHYYIPPSPPPEEKSFWEKIIGAFGDLFSYIAYVVDLYSTMYSQMKAMAVEIGAGVLSYSTTGGLVKCADIPGCYTVLNTALNVAMTAAGLPPTLPTSAELTDMGTEYLIKLGADQLGAGEAYDAAKDIYKDLPDEVKSQMHDRAESTAEVLIDEQAKQRQDMVFNSRNCVVKYNFSTGINDYLDCANRTPDPIFSGYHPATVMVYVENPNPANGPVTDRVVLEVSDSWNLYNNETRVIPSLRPGEGISVPVVLYENYNQFRQRNGGPCNEDTVTTTSSQYGPDIHLDDQDSCVGEKWSALFQQPGEDSFKVTFSVRNGVTMNAELDGLDESSNGKGLQTLINTDGTCNIQKSVRYPAGWQIYTTGYSIKPTERDYLFEENGVISMTRGYMRKK